MPISLNIVTTMSKYSVADITILKINQQTTANSVYNDSGEGDAESFGHRSALGMFNQFLKKT